MTVKDTSFKNIQLLNWLKDNKVLLISLAIGAFLSLYNLGKIEFWGEDEAQTLLYASRFILGLKNQSLANATAFYNNSTFSFVILIQVPFILLFGVTELASRMPSAIITILTLFVIYKIGKLYLDKKSLNVLILTYSVSGAVGLFKSSIGVGFYIFFVLLAFLYIERFFYHKNKDQRGRFNDLHLCLIFLVMALIAVPDAYFFIPYFFVLILLNIKKIGAKRLFKSLIIPVILFASFVYYEFILARQLTGADNATYDHFIGRQSGLALSFNLKEFVFGFITSYSIYFVAIFIISIIFLVVITIMKKAKIPGILIRSMLLFSLHFIIWMFLTKGENGHLMNSYPVALFFIAYAYRSADEILFHRKHSKFKISNKIPTPKLILNLFLIILLCLNFYHTFILFNDLSLNKNKYPAFYSPGKVPAGYVYGHKLGIKSAAYLLRKDKTFTGGLVSHHGSAFNFIYMGGEMIVYNSSNAIEYMISGEDITKNYKIRYISISPDFQNKEYLDYIDSKGYKKISITHNNEEIYRIYDILNRNNEIIVIDRDQYDIEYDKKYSKIDVALPYFNTF